MPSRTSHTINSYIHEEKEVYRYRTRENGSDIKVNLPSQDTVNFKIPPGLYRHSVNENNEADITALYYKLSQNGVGGYVGRADSETTPVNSQYFTNYDVNRGQMNNLNHGDSVRNTYMSTSRPSLRSQREHLAAQAKGMPRITGVHFEKKSPAWVANWKENGSKKRVWFRVSEFGMDEAYRKAVETRKEAEDRFPKKDRSMRKERRRQIVADFNEQLKALPRIMGVRFDRFDMAWVASWTADRKERKKMFSIHTHGFEGARQLAIEHREEKLKEMEDDRLRNITDQTESPEGITYEKSTSKFMDRGDSSSAAVYFDTATQSWVTCWADTGMTRLTRFPTSNYGFEDAYRMAVDYKKYSKDESWADYSAPPRSVPIVPNKIMGTPDNIPDTYTKNTAVPMQSYAEPVEKLKQPTENLSQEEYKGLIIECLMDLKDRVIGQKSSVTGQGDQSPQLLNYHLEAVKSASSEHELRPYLTLFSECFLRKQLPSSAGVEAQQSILHTLSLLMTLTQLLADNDANEKEDDKDDINHNQDDKLLYNTNITNGSETTDEIYHRNENDKSKTSP